MSAFLTGTSPVLLTDNEWVTVVAALINAGQEGLAAAVKTQVLGERR